MIDSKKLLKGLQGRVKLLEDDLRERCDTLPEVDAPLKARYDEAKEKGRTAFTYSAWRDDELTQIAVAWVLACVFVRFLEDNELIEVPKLAGPGDRLQRAVDEHELYFQQFPTATERDYLEALFAEVGQMPAMREFFDKRHNALWSASPSGDACRELVLFWRKADAETSELVHDFTDSEWGTRFLGDLYQDLSEAVRKKYALLQTPDFVEEFILDRTLTPAIETFGYRQVRMIDPTCGSGHFLLGGFGRLLTIWQNECPGENPRVLAQNALNGVYGVDLNPYAVAVARFRLLLVALKASGIKRLKNAPDFQINLAVGDSLIHGARFDSEGKPHVVARQDMFGGEDEVFQDEVAHFFDSEDSETLHIILGQQYHAVVGNPPYITVKDKSLSKLYRTRYEACHRSYALSVPFMERFFDLALTASGESGGTAGFTGQITANSFMKREFGKKLIEEHIPRWNLTHLIDAGGAYIPGHGTPTVIIFGRNAKPSTSTVRTIMGIKGEPATPEDPSNGKVWNSIITQLDQSESENEFVSSADTERVKFHKHPWSLQGGGASQLKSLIEDAALSLETKIDTPIGRAVRVAEEDAFLRSENESSLVDTRSEFRTYLEGDCVRDWQLASSPLIWYPYPITGSRNSTFLNRLWPQRTKLAARSTFQGKMVDAGREWFEYQQHTSSAYSSDFSITFAEVATHNNFVLDRGGKVFKQTAPVIKLPMGATEDDHLILLGSLNSSVACFWIKQVFHNKGDSTDKHGARTTGEVEFNTYQIDGTKLRLFPLPAGSPLKMARALDFEAQELSNHSPRALATSGALDSLTLAEAKRLSYNSLSRMISLQEELDWQCYRFYGLIETSDNLEWPEDRLDDLPPLQLGERTFEIRMARQMAAGELETKWFERHEDAGSKAITELPSHWPEEYRNLIERRLAFIESNKNINLIERPEYKRRWNTESWAKRQDEALRKWLLARLEGYFFEGSRVCELKDGFDPAGKGFAAASEPSLMTVNQLADVVQHDAKWMEGAEAYHGASGFSVPQLLKKLVETEVVPFLPGQRYKESGLRKREDWEKTWELQRAEDAVEHGVLSQHPDKNDEQLKELIRDAQQQQVGDIAVPPKYASKDFKKPSYWKMRGKLDVAKERWVSYPGCGRDHDTSELIAWAGWDHSQQAQALASYYVSAKTEHGWGSERLLPLLAGVKDLLPWLNQWHNDPNNVYGVGLGDFYTGFLNDQCSELGISLDEVEATRVAV